MYARALENAFARDVRCGLMRSPQKTLSCTYFYDELGSALFEAITCLPEYGLTRADARVLCANAGRIVARLPGNVVVAELGSGSGVKTRSILEQLRKQQTVVYHPIDVSGSSLARCARDLEAFGEIRPHETNYLAGLRQVAESRPSGSSVFVLFLGSTIGNFAPDDAIDFLYALRQRLEPGDTLLLGTDMVKPVEIMIRAYDDPTGVTAAFNLNLLARINRELGGDFDLRRFRHEARYDPAAQRIEMHLRSKADQIVNIPGADLTVEFAEDETIWTESCHKFVPSQIEEMARTAGFRVDASWTDVEWPFTETLLEAV